MSISNYQRMIDDMRYAGRTLAPTGPRSVEQATVCSGAPVSRPGPLPLHAVVRKGNRLVARDRLTVTDSVTRSRITGNWHNLPGTSTRARVIRNYR